MNRFVWVGETEVYSRPTDSDPDREWTRQVSSVHTPYKQRTVPNQLIIEPLTFEPLEEKEIWIRYDGQYNVIDFELVRPQAFLTKQQSGMSLIGGYLGLAGLMILLNGFLGAATKRPVHIYYILYTASIAFYLFCTEGLAYRYIWPESPRWQQTADVFMVEVSFFWGTLMTNEFLRLPAHNKKLYRTLRIYLVVFLCMVLWYLFFPHYLIGAAVNSMVIVFLLLYLGAGLYRKKQGYEPAIYYLFGTGIFFISVILKTLVGLIPMPFPDLFIAAMYIGSGIELTILSYALAIQILHIYQANLKYQDELTLANRELIQLGKEKDDFMSNISHELRTPLHGIIGIAQGIIDQNKQSGNDQDVNKLNMVVRSGTRLTNLIDDIIDFNQIKEKGINLKLRPVSFHFQHNIIATHFQSQLRAKSLAFNAEIPVDLPPLLADEEPLQQILFNLVGNAIKFTTKGTITLGAEEKGKRIEIWIQDTGAGIARDEIEKIFKPYIRGQSATIQQTEGSGLGLALTRSLIELHHSQLRVSSKLEEGSRFFFDLEIAPEGEEVILESPPIIK